MSNSLTFAAVVAPRANDACTASRAPFTASGIAPLTGAWSHTETTDTVGASALVREGGHEAA